MGVFQVLKDNDLSTKDAFYSSQSWNPYRDAFESCIPKLRQNAYFGRPGPLTRRDFIPIHILMRISSERLVFRLQRIRLARHQRWPDGGHEAQKTDRLKF